MSRFREEIGEQPELLRRLIEESGATVAQIGRRIRDTGPRGLLIAARGSSDNAAQYAKYLFGVRNRLLTALAAPSLFTHYASPPSLDGWCVIGISQSGASPDVIAIVEEARRRQCTTLAITNEPGSALAKTAELVLPLGAGLEESVPASKTYTASLLALALVSEAMAPASDLAANLRLVPDAVAAAIGREAEIQEAARVIQGPRAVVLGRGFNFSTAEEVALKLNETSYVLARAWSPADFEHGPAALLEPGLPVVLVDGGGDVQGDLESMRARVTRQGGPLVELRERSALPEVLTPIPLAVLGQLLAYHVAADRGIDPDHPRTLHKVTRTW